MPHRNFANLTYDSMIAASLNDAHVATMLHKNNWRLGEETSWQMDQQSGHLMWLFDNGDFALAPIQVIGSYHSKEKSFLWSWDHPSILPALQKYARSMKAFGKMHSAKELTKNRISCAEDKAWELTALSMKLNNAVGAYRVQIKPDVSLFLNFGEVQFTTAAEKTI